MLFALATRADRLGLRPLVARAANLAYPGQRFAVDADGDWVNRQPECTIVSPTIHTTPYASFRSWVEHHWLWRYRARADDIVFDVGAGVGEETIVMSKLGARVFAIEAHPRTFRCLTKTVARSGLERVAPLQVALAERDGSASISSGSAHLANTIMAGGGDEQVTQRSLDSLVAELELDRIDFLRSNIEGAEKLAIRGMSQSVRLIRNICISCHDFIAERGDGKEFRTKAEVVPFLRDAGFTVTLRDPEPDQPWIGDYVYGTRDI